MIVIKPRDWYYQLPNGQTAVDMKEGREILSKESGHNFSSESFRNLVKKGIIKKVTKISDEKTI